MYVKIGDFRRPLGKQRQTYFPPPVLMVIGVSLNEWAYSKAHGLGYIPIGSARRIIRKVGD